MENQNNSQTQEQQDNGMTQSDREELLRLRQENAKLKQQSTLKNGLKVSEKGAVSIYGYGRFPITCYAPSLIEILDRHEEIRAFIELNKTKLSWARKVEAKTQPVNGNVEVETTAKGNLVDELVAKQG